MTTIAALKQKETYITLLKQLKYALYVIFHPADGFWCLMREKKASVASANIILLFYAIVNVSHYMMTNFQFITVNTEYFNAIYPALSIIIPIVLWSLANWGFTTLMNGKGRLQDVYVATVYAFTPNIIFGAVCIGLSHVMTYDEGVLYYTILSIAAIWSVLLILVAMMQIHDYTMLKAIFSSLLSIAGIGFILFVFMLFFSLVSNAVIYIIGLYEEIVFRLY